MNLSKEFEHLIEFGYVKLPIYKYWKDDIRIENINSMYSCNLASHELYLNDSGIKDILVPQLYDLTKKIYSELKINSSDIYKVTRLLTHRDKNECYRSHFDSHIYTLVTPIIIPKFCSGSAGELYLFNNIRNEPVNEFDNILGKFSFARYKGYNGFSNLCKKRAPLIFSFSDMSPLLFFGRRCFHGNLPWKPSDNTINSYRLTLLTHFFDPSPSLGLSSLVRIIRNR